MALYVEQCFVDRLLDIDIKKIRKWSKFKIENIYLFFLSTDGVVLIEIFKCSFITELERHPQL